MKLKNMNVYTKAKVLFKFGSLEIVCAYGNEIQKAIQIVTKLIHVSDVYVHALTHVKALYFIGGL